jgi:heat shock protein HtpX
MFIVNPYAGFRGGGMVSMFSTHPPTPDRIARLQHIAQQMGQPSQANQ